MSSLQRRVVVWLVLIAISIGNVGCLSSDPSKSFSDVYGTWDDIPTTPANSTWDLSWGTGEVVLHVTFAVHGVEDSIVFIIPDHGRFKATSIRQIGEARFTFSLESALGQTIQDVTLRIVDDDTIAISAPGGSDSATHPFGPDVSGETLYYRRAGPSDE